MDSLFSEVFLIVSVVIVQIKLRSSPEIKDYDYADCRESDVTSGMYIILNSTQDTSKDELQYSLPFQHARGREQERRSAVLGRQVASRGQQQDRRRKVVKPVTPAMP